MSELDFQLDEALYWDYFARTYGWTKDQAETENPHWLLNALATIGAVRDEIKRERQSED